MLLKIKFVCDLILLTVYQSTRRSTQADASPTKILGKSIKVCFKSYSHNTNIRTDCPVKYKYITTRGPTNFKRNIVLSWWNFRAVIRYTRFHFYDKKSQL